MSKTCFANLFGFVSISDRTDTHGEIPHCVICCKTSPVLYLKKLRVAIRYIKRVSSKMEQLFCMFKGPLEAHV